jgi:hypothetical protein
VDHALRAAGDVARTPAGGWRLALSNGTSMDVCARIDQDWLQLTTPAPTRHDEREAWWHALQLNTALRDSVRLVCVGHGTSQIRAEIFIGATEGSARHGCPLEQRIGTMCEQLRRAHDEVCLGSRVVPAPVSRCEPAPSHDDLVRMCSELGWSATPLEGGDVAVPLDCRAAGARARLSLSSESGLDAVVPLIAGPIASDASRAAIALLLLGVSATVRLVKAVVVGDGDRAQAGLAAACEPVRSSHALERILAALSIACDLAGREVQALERAPVALDYLALRHPSWHATPETVTPVHELEAMPCP